MDHPLSLLVCMQEPTPEKERAERVRQTPEERGKMKRQTGETLQPGRIATRETLSPNRAGEGGMRTGTASEQWANPAGIKKWMQKRFFLDQNGPIQKK